MNYCECSVEEIEAEGFSVRNGKAVCNNCGNPDISEKPMDAIHSADALKAQQNQGNFAAKEENADLSRLIAAQNRTTHAVRSLAITIVAAPLVSFIVLVAVGIAFATQNIGVMVIVGLAGFLVLMIVLFQTLDELRKSKV